MENNKEARLKSKKAKNKLLLIGGIFLMFLGTILFMWGLIAGTIFIINWFPAPSGDEASTAFLSFDGQLMLSGSIMFVSSFFVLSKRKI